MYISVDVESDGPIPYDYSMICFGAVLLDRDLNITKTFYGQLQPISDKYIPEALAVSGFSREETLLFPEPIKTMTDFLNWIKSNCGDTQVRFFSDNVGYDWQFINWYFHHFLGNNPFGWSSINIKNLYNGIERNMRRSHKYLRTTKHTHHPVDDAMGNAEAVVKMIKNFGLRMF